jgi:hypothetical protein
MGGVKTPQSISVFVLISPLNNVVFPEQPPMISEEKRFLYFSHTEIALPLNSYIECSIAIK